MSADLVWEEPPAKAPRQHSYPNSQTERLIAELKKRPGKYARVYDAVAHHKAAALKKKGCLVEVRPLEEDMGKPFKQRRYNVWAAWPAPDPKEIAKTATPEQLAKAYAEKQGARLAPGPARPAESDEAARVSAQLKNRLLHGKTAR